MMESVFTFGRESLAKNCQIYCWLDGRRAVGLLSGHLRLRKGSEAEKTTFSRESLPLSIANFLIHIANNFRPKVWPFQGSASSIEAAEKNSAYATFKGTLI